MPYVYHLCIFSTRYGLWLRIWVELKIDPDTEGISLVIGALGVGFGGNSTRYLRNGEMERQYPMERFTASLLVRPIKFLPLIYPFREFKMTLHVHVQADHIVSSTIQRSLVASNNI